MRDEAITRVTELITGFTAESHKGLSEAVAVARAGVTEREEALDGFTVEHEAEAGRVVETAEGLVSVLQGREAEGRQIKEDGIKVGLTKSSSNNRSPPTSRHRL
jgi:hypothetical protein